MNSPKKICVIGGGSWGKNHIRTLNDLGSLSAVVDSSETVISELNNIYSDCKFFKNVEDTIQFDYDGYIVATPPNTHYEIAKKIINIKKPLLVEKPITLNLKDALELNKLAKNKKVNLYVGHLLLFHPAYLKIKQMIDNNSIGEIEYIYSNRLNLGTIRKDENVFWSFAPHDIALIQFFLKSFPSSISSDGSAIIRKNIHDSTITCLKYDNGVMAHIFVSWLHPYKEHKFIIIGSKGMISFEDSLKDKPLIYYDKKIDWIDGETIPHQGSSHNVTYDNTSALENELIYFLDTLDKFPITKINGDSAVEVIKILEIATEDLIK